MVEDSAKDLRTHTQVSHQCRKQVKYELMVQSENLVLNEPLYAACQGDLQRLCPSMQTSEGKVGFSKAESRYECSARLTFRGLDLHC